MRSDDMPVSLGLFGTAICGARKLECTNAARALLLNPASLYKTNSEYVDKCDCRPSCTAIDYHAEVYQSKANFDNYFAETNLTNKRLYGTTRNGYNIFQAQALLGESR